MILRFATKRNSSGNRYYLAIDTINKTFARESAHWYTKDDITEISKSDRRKLIEQVENENYIEIDHL